MNLKTLRTALALAAVCSLGAAAPANAGVLVDSARDCPEQEMDQKFLPWLDIFNYTLVPGGSFETGAAGWTLSGGASVVSGNEPWKVTSGGDAMSLSLPAGSSATSPAVCAGLSHLFLRYFSRRASTSLLGSLTSSLQTDVLFEDAGGNVRSLPLLNLSLGTAWAPTLPIPVVANLLPLLPGERTAIAFRFTPRGSSSWRIDDVYLDPYKRS